MELPSYRISVTTLESFRRFLTAEEDSNFDTEEQLIDTLKGKFEGNDKTRFGSAFHKVVESPEIHKGLDLVSVDINDPSRMKPGTPLEPEVLLPAHIADIAVNHRKSFPYMICEVRATKTYELQKYMIQVSGILDGLDGATIKDSKTKFRAPKATEYMSSYQWRFYLDMLNLKAFDYHLFEVKYFDSLVLEFGKYSVKATTGRDKQPREIAMVAHEPIRCVSYLGITRDCTNLIEEFMEYIENRNLFHLLKPATQNEAILF